MELGTPHGRAEACREHAMKPSILSPSAPLPGHTEKLPCGTYSVWDNRTIRQGRKLTASEAREAVRIDLGDRIATHLGPPQP